METRRINSIGHRQSGSSLAVATILFCLYQSALWPASAEIRDGGIDPANLGKGEWLYYMSNATNQLGGYVSSVTNEDSLMLYLQSQGTRYVIVKAATSDQLFNGSYALPQFTSNLVNTAHVHGLWIFGYNRSYGANVPAEIAIADYVFNQGADGFVWDAEAEWESSQPWIGTNGPALAWQLCSAVRSNWPTKFLAHAPFPIIGSHSSFPYKEFGYWSDAVMPQIYHFSTLALKRSVSAGINWTDVNWIYYQNLWSNLPPQNINGLAVYWTNAIKPLVPVQDVYGAPYTSPTPDKDVQEFMDYLAADPNTPALGGYGGANFFRADLHDAQQWAYISGGTLGAAPGLVNNIVLDDPVASVVGTATSVRTFYLTNNMTPLFEGCGSGTDTNSFGTNYLVLAQGSGGNYVEFTPTIVVPGDYRVYQWHPYRAEASASVPFVISYYGGSTTVYANQQTNDGNWSALGTFTFAAGTAGNIRISDAVPESGGLALADGIKLVFASSATVGPAAPGGLTASAASSSRIDLVWSNHATNAVHNVVARSTIDGGPYMDVAVVPFSSTGWSDRGLAPETTYYYVVRAANGAGPSGNSGQASATTTVAPPAAPTIVLHPVSRTVMAGSNVTFSVIASGLEPLSYQWRHEGTNIAGATQSAYSLASAQARDAGTYSAVVTNAVGSATSLNAVLTVQAEVLYTLAITKVGYGSVTKIPDAASYPAGTVVTLTAAESAGYSFGGWTGDITSTDNPVSVTMDTNLAITANFKPLPTDIVVDNADAGAMFSGSWATSSTSTEGYGPDYRWVSTVVSGSGSSVTYRPTITVAGYYSIYVIYRAGSNRAYSTPIRIQTDDAYLQVGVNQQINGGTWLPLVSQTAHLSPGKDVYVEISNVTGYSGYVVVADAVRFELYQSDATGPPVITSQPVSQVVSVEGTASFSVTASGNWPLSYSWQRNGVPIAGATDSTYTTIKVQLADSGTQFSCLVTNSFGSSTSEVATLTVIDLTITSQPVSQNKNPGESVTFSVTAIGSSPLSYQWLKDGIPLAQGTDASLTLASLQGIDAGAYQVVVTNPQGSLSSAVAVLTVNLATPDSFNGASDKIVYSLAVQPDGKVLAGGPFTRLGGQTRSGIGRFHPDGALDTNFNPGASPPGAACLAVQPDGKIVAGGVFTTLGGMARSAIGRLNSDGTLDTTFNPGASGYVFCLVLQEDQKILVGGYYSALGGQTRYHLGRLNPNGTIDAGFNPGPNAAVYSMAVQPDGKILVAGDFTTVAGQARQRIARLNANGTIDAGFNPGANATVFSMAVQPDGKILVGGDFAVLAGQARQRIARLNPDGTVDTGFDPGANDSVVSISLQANGKTLVSGKLTMLGGQTRNGLGRLNSGGTVDLTFNAGISGPQPSAPALALQADGKILVGGTFTNLGGVARSGIGRLCTSEPALESLSYDGSNLTWLRGGMVPEFWRTTLEISSDGTNWPSAIPGNRVAGSPGGEPVGWQWTNTSLSATSFLRVRGFVTGGFGNGSSWFVETNLVGAVLRTHYVAANSTNPVSPYMSWATAAQVIQDAVDAAEAGDQIVVTNGVYATGGRTVGTNLLVNRVAVDKPLRLRSVNGPEFTIIQGYQVPGTTNGENAVRCVYLGDNAVLSGFTLTNGATRTWGSSEADCNGGGVWCEARNAVVSNCVIVGNSAIQWGGGACQGTLLDCLIAGNRADMGGGAGACSLLKGCTLTGNNAGFGGGAALCALDKCVLAGNSAHYRGGAVIQATLNNCIIRSNSATWGGGLATDWFMPCYATNCVLVGNSAGVGGGVDGGEDIALLNNCIVYFNTATNGANYTEFAWSGLNYCCTKPMPIYGFGNITNLPLFVDDLNGNLRLQSNSPCINAGNNAFSTGLTDFEGHPRIVSGRVDIGAYEYQGAGSRISYAWLQQFGLATDGSVDDLDLDGDGHSTWQEWRCQTDPTTALSALRLLSASVNGTGVTLIWQSVAGVSYFVECCTNLVCPFTPLEANIIGKPATTEFTHVTQTGAAPLFYRIGVGP